MKKRIKSTKMEVISLKIDSDLSHLLKDVKNRSEFIRKAILKSLGSTCPLCDGTGYLTPEGQEYWKKLNNKQEEL